MPRLLDHSDIKSLLHPLNAVFDDVMVLFLDKIVGILSDNLPFMLGSEQVDHGVIYVDYFPLNADAQRVWQAFDHGFEFLFCRQPGGFFRSVFLFYGACFS